MFVICVQPPTPGKIVAIHTLVVTKPGRGPSKLSQLSANLRLLHYGKFVEDENAEGEMNAVSKEMHAFKINYCVIALSHKNDAAIMNCDTY